MSSNSDIIVRQLLAYVVKLIGVVKLIELVNSFKIYEESESEFELESEAYSDELLLV